jgi:hypothetical protein
VHAVVDPEGSVNLLKSGLVHVAARTSAPVHPANAALGLVSEATIEFAICLRSSKRRESRLLERALLSEAKMTLESIPIMAMTTNNSIRVKPRDERRVNIFILIY